MKSLCRILIVALALNSAARAEEVLENRDFSQLKNGVPVNWTYQDNATNKRYEAVPPANGEPGYVRITGADKKASGVIAGRRIIRCPAGTLTVLSGEYRTKNLEFGSKGQITVSRMGRSLRNSNRKPLDWLNAEKLQPTSEWTRFSVAKRLTVDIQEFQIYLALRNASGTVEFRNLSLDCVPPSRTPDPKEEYIWREAEDLDASPVAKWGEETPGYFSGRGGIKLYKRNFNWTFRLDPRINPADLHPIARTFHVWARVYGYLESPRILVYHGKKLLSAVDTPPNEKTDDKGKYAGPGEYVWVYCGQFTAAEGLQELRFNALGRTLIDALLLTTDGQYAPVKYEAKEMKQTPVTDLTLNHMIRAEYALEGVTDTLPLPVSFRCVGKDTIIPNDQPPAKFHFSLPEFIKVKNVSSHRAGTNWKHRPWWGEKFLTFRQTGTRVLNGVKMCDYEADLYFLSRNQYMIYIQAEGGEFKPGRKSVCEYYLENRGEVQPRETLVLNHIHIPTVRPFKNIRIGASHVPIDVLYRSLPDTFDTLKKCGFNFIGCWHMPWMDRNLDSFRDAAYANGFLMAVVVEQYKKFRPEDIAYGLDDRPLDMTSAIYGKVMTLAMDENTPSIADVLHRTKLCASLGLSVEYDDEMTNQLGDKADYAPATKELFRKWLAENHPGTAYVDPVTIVKNRDADRKLYELWVDFKCDRVAYWYSLYRRAFDEGLALAAGKYPADAKPQLITCVQGYKPDFPTPQSLKEKDFFDFRKLLRYCDRIAVMSYSYNGVAGAADPADTVEMFAKYTGTDRTGVTLLAGGYGTEIAPENKVMLKYEVLDCLMSKARLIEFYAGATLFNAPTLVHVVKAIEIALPYEDFFVNGEVYSGMKSSLGYVRLKGLKLDNRLLLYATNYNNPTGTPVTVTFPQRIRKVTDCESGTVLPAGNDSFSFDFKTERGRMFIIEL